jgi:hypothetical protein
MPNIIASLENANARFKLREFVEESRNKTHQEIPQFFKKKSAPCELTFSKRLVIAERIFEVKKNTILNRTDLDLLWNELNSCSSNETVDEYKVHLPFMNYLGNIL